MVSSRSKNVPIPKTIDTTTDRPYNCSGTGRFIVYLPPHLWGSAVDQCDQCGALRISYNSCRNRHCPKCGALAKERWLARQQADLLPIEYFHLVFTIDHEVHRLASFNERAIYNLLFHSATETLKAFGQKYLGGEIGITAILHTWGQNLSQHIHLHCIVTGGALSADGKKWQSAQKGFLFPVVELSAAFRQCFCAGLKKLHAKGRLQFPDQMVNLQSFQAFDAWAAGMASKRWQVYVKESWGHPEEVLAYFGRYTHRIAISNSRILGIENGKVRFTWKDYRDNGKTKVMTLTAEEFIRRFLQHVHYRTVSYVCVIMGSYTVCSGARNYDVCGSCWVSKVTRAQWKSPPTT